MVWYRDSSEACQKYLTASKKGPTWVPSLVIIRYLGQKSNHLGISTFKNACVRNTLNISPRHKIQGPLSTFCKFNRLLAIYFVLQANLLTHRHLYLLAETPEQANQLYYPIHRITSPNLWPQFQKIESLKNSQRSSFFVLGFFCFRRFQLRHCPRTMAVADF